MLTLGKVLIIGDSYSTFTGHIPEGHHAWYTPGGHDQTDVDAVEQTWWHQLMRDTDSTLVRNDSFSGATVCNTERPTIPGTSFIIRTDRLIADGFFESNDIDTILVFGGTNDSWIDAPIGEIPTSDVITDADRLCVLPAFAYLLRRLADAAPRARITAIINCDLKEEIAQGFAEIAHRLGVHTVPLVGISKQNGHPDRVGMAEIKDQLLSALGTRD